MIDLMIYSDDYENANECVVALGCFDGVHRGHQALISRARKVANEKKLPLVIWVLDMNRSNSLTSQDEKFQLLKRLGADAIISENFEKIRNMSCQDFVVKLIQEYKTGYAVCGFNFTFGIHATGDAAFLKKLMEDSGKQAEIVDEVCLDDGTKISSTAVRNALTSGNPLLAAKMLGRFYEINSVVEHGYAIGTKLGFPTANQKIPPNRIIPRLGVYRSFCDVGADRYHGVTNVGSRPTFNGAPDAITVETFILGEVGDLYGKKLSVKLADFLRPEKYFEDKDELIEAINKDVEKVKKECGIK